MSAVDITTICKDCGEQLRVKDVTTGANEACSKCGSTAKAIKSISANIVASAPQMNIEFVVKSKEKSKSGTGSKVRRQREQYWSVDLSADGVRRRVYRDVDRKNDQYVEIVSNEDSGMTEKLVREPLSAHVGKGSAKKRP